MKIIEVSIPEQRTFDGQPFPAVLSPEGSATREEVFAWLTDRGGLHRLDVGADRLCPASPVTP